MSASQNLIQTNAMPPQTIKPLMPGATSPGESARLQQQQQIKTQMEITGKTVGGKLTRRRSRRKYKGRGGAAQIAVPQPPAGSVPPGSGSATQANYTAVTTLAANQQQQATYDKTVNGGPASVAVVQQQNNKLYQSGGKRRTAKKRRAIRRQRASRRQRAGNSVKWGCLSGGKTNKRRKYN